MKKILFTMVLALSVMLLSGCGSNDFDVHESNNSSVENNNSGDNGAGDSNDNGGTENNDTSDLISKYQFFNATTPLTISKESKEYTIGVQLLYDGHVSPQKTVELLAFAGSKPGMFKEYKVQTGKDGYALFHYTAPKPLPANGTEQILTVKFWNKAGKSISQNIKLRFNKSVNTADTYTFMNQKSLIKVTTPEQNETILVVVVDNDGVGVSGQKVTATFPSLNNKYVGIIDKSVAITGDNGVATFTYTAPKAKDFNNGAVRITLRNNNVNNPAIVTVQLEKDAVVSEYKLSNTCDTVKIDDVSKPKDVVVQLTKNGIPIAGQVVSSKAIDCDYGYLKQASVTTGEDGFARFVWMPPKKKPEGEQKTTIQFVHITEDNGAETNTSVVLDLNGTDFLDLVYNVRVKRDPIVVNDNSKTFNNIKICVDKDGRPVQDENGTVMIKLPKFTLDNGIDIGLFDKYTKTLNDHGCAYFGYTGPSNLKHTREQIQDANITFKYSMTPQKSDSLAIHFNEPLHPVDDSKYYAEITTSDSDFAMELNSTKIFTINLRAKDQSGNSIDPVPATIKNIHIASKNTNIAMLIGKEDNNEHGSLDLNASNNTFRVKSQILSGLVPVMTTITYDDSQGKEHNTTCIVSVRVYSGLPTAISISYIGVTQDKERGKYMEKLAISVTDEYGNKVDDRCDNYLSVGAIVGYAVDGSEPNGKETSTSKRLFYGKTVVDSGNADGKMEPLGGDKAQFVDESANRSSVFKYVAAEGKYTDKLVVFGERKNYEAMGKWDIEEKITDNTLGLKDDYYGKERSGLYYAVGHNYYQDQCLEDGREWIGATDTEETNTSIKLDGQGTAIVTYKYDYHLTGKDAMIWVNLVGYQPDTGKTVRVGEAAKHTLRGMGLKAAPESYTLPKGARALKIFKIHHANAPEWYRNAHFGADVKHDCQSVKYVISSNDFDARTCQSSRQYTMTRNLNDSYTVQYPDANGTQIASQSYTKTDNSITETITLKDEKGVEQPGKVVKVLLSDSSSLISDVSQVTDNGNGSYTFTVYHNHPNTKFENSKLTADESGKGSFKVYATRTETHLVGGPGDGTAYVIYDVTAPADKSCSIKLENIVTADEF